MPSVASARRAPRSAGAFLLLLAMLALCLPVASFGQAQNKGTVAGSVYDASHSVIPNATVTLTSDGQGNVYTAKSNTQGEYTFNDIPGGSYTLQAAIAAVHAEAESIAATNWRQIVALYNQLARIQPSPVVELNRAVAIAMRDGPEAGLTHIDAVLEHGELANYYLAHSARADMYRRLGRTTEARSAYEKALALTQQEPERQFLQERIRQLK